MKALVISTVPRGRLLPSSTRTYHPLHTHLVLQHLDAVVPLLHLASALLDPLSQPVVLVLRVLEHLASREQLAVQVLGPFPRRLPLRHLCLELQQAGLCSAQLCHHLLAVLLCVAGSGECVLQLSL